MAGLTSCKDKKDLITLQDFKVNAINPVGMRNATADFDITVENKAPRITVEQAVLEIYNNDMLLGTYTPQTPFVIERGVSTFNIKGEAVLDGKVGLIELAKIVKNVRNTAFSVTAVITGKVGAIRKTITVENVPIKL